MTSGDQQSAIAGYRLVRVHHGVGRLHLGLDGGAVAMVLVELPLQQRSGSTLNWNAATSHPGVGLVRGSPDALSERR